MLSHLTCLILSSPQPSHPCHLPSPHHLLLLPLTSSLCHPSIPSPNTPSPSDSLDYLTTQSLASLIPPPDHHLTSHPVTPLLYSTSFILSSHSTSLTTSPGLSLSVTVSCHRHQRWSRFSKGPAMTLCNAPEKPEPDTPASNAPTIHNLPLVGTEEVRLISALSSHFIRKAPRS